MEDNTIFYQTGYLIGNIIVLILLGFLIIYIRKRLSHLSASLPKNKNIKFTFSDTNSAPFSNAYSQPHQPQDSILLYKKRYILTLNEKAQYYHLKPITDKLNLNLFVKIRLADIIEPTITNNYTAFNKIKAKHIDFMIYDQSLNLVCALELDDNSHNRKDRIERDIFVNDALASCGIKLIRSYNFKNMDMEKILGELIATNQKSS